MFLADFSVIKPDPGLIIWTSAIFLFLWFFLGRAAFGPIAKALREREDSIDDALKSADKARAEMQKLQAENDEILAQARAERSKILQEAKATKESIIKKAEVEAKEKANKIIASATVEIAGLKRSALSDAKKQVGGMAIDIAEKVMQRELKGNQESFVASLVKDIQMN